MTHYSGFYDVFNDIIYLHHLAKPNISERINSHPPSHQPSRPTIIKPQQATGAKSTIKPVANENEMNLNLSDNHQLQDALHFKPLPSKHLPIDETAELDREIITKPDESSTNSHAFKGVSLKDFESQRRMVEEQNKQKKEILYRAIEHQ